MTHLPKHWLYTQGPISNYSIKAVGFLPESSAVFFSPSRITWSQQCQVYTAFPQPTQPTAHPLCLLHGDFTWNISINSLSLIGPHPHPSVHFPSLPSIVTTAWHVLRLRMEETASRYGG
jgi:hypothetical protein